MSRVIVHVSGLCYAVLTIIYLPIRAIPLSPSSVGSGVATLSDYREHQPQSSAKGDDDAQQFYAGGSEHSGQMIEGPPRKKANPQDIAKEVFEAARK